MASLALAGIAYLLAIREFFRGRGPIRLRSGQLRATPDVPRRIVVVGLVLAAVWHAEFLRLPPGADDDIHRYVWDGRLQRLGYNPYLVVPGDPAAKGLHTPETRNLNNPDLPSPYPPGAQLFFRAVTAIHESAFALKVAFVVCEFTIVVVLLDILRRTGKGAHLVLAFAWNPLLAIEVAGSGHIDIVGALLVVVSAAALAAAVVGLLYVPFLNHGHIPIGSLGTYVQSFRFNGPVFAALGRVAPPQLLAGLAVLAGLATATWLRRRGAACELSPDAFAWDLFIWPMAASLLFAPVVFPWYLLWLLPFLTSASTLLIIVWTVSIIPVYVQWHLRALGRPWGALPGWAMLVEYGCVAIAAAIVWLRRSKEPEHADARSD